MRTTTVRATGSLSSRRAIALASLLGWSSTARAQGEVAAEDDGLRAALERAATAFCIGPPVLEADTTEPGPCGSVSIREAGGPGLRGLVADVVSGQRIGSILAVEGGGEIRVETLAVGWAPGVGAHSAEGETSIEALDLVDGGDPELHAVFTGVASDSDMGTCDRVGRDTEVHVLCSADGGSLRCVALETTRRSFVEHELCGDVLDADGDGDREEPRTGEREVHRVRGYALTLSFDDGRVRLRPSPDDTRAAPLSGSFRAPSLLRRRALSWPDRFDPASLTAL